ncbi:MAG: hypothetical protein M3Y35_02520 [Actinomycetota bacterium]|nr:hypothetical protein [Actinomycetota bacterium]
MTPTAPPIDPGNTKKAIGDIVGQARDAYNALPETARNIITVGIAIACVLIIVKVIGSVLGRAISLVIAAVAVFILWKYLPDITAALGITGRLAG